MQTTMDIEKTVKAAQNGDKKAVEELYKNYIGEIKTVAKCYFPNEDDAEDAASEIFLLVIQKIGTIKKPAAFNGWLKKVIENKCVSMLRKKHEFTMDDEEYIENECNTDTESCPEVVPHEKLDNDETQKIIYNIVSELPEKYKSVILMYYYSNMSVESIGKALDISEGTVKSRLSYARDKIEKEIRAYEKKGIKLYSIDILKSLGQIISNISQNTQVTTQFSTVMNSLASSSGTFTSALSTITTTQVSNIVSTSVARTISNATATRISVVASAVVVATCTAVTQLPPTDAQNEDSQKTSIVYETSVIHDTSVVEVTVVETTETEKIVKEKSTVKEISTIYQTSTVHDISTVHDTSIIETTLVETSTVYEPSLVYIEGEPSIVYVEKIVETDKPAKDYSVYHYEEDDMFRYKVYDNANEAEIVKVWKVPENQQETWNLPDTFNEIPVTKIGRGVFEEQNIPENIKLGENVEEIGRAAFRDCQSLKSIELNDKITEIAPRTFENCKNLETVTGGKNIEVIGENAFLNTSLKAVNFSTALKSVEYNAFGQHEFEEIVFPDSLEYLSEGEYYSYPTAKNVTMYINTDKAEERKEMYKNIEQCIFNYAENVHIIFTGNAVRFHDTYWTILEELFDSFPNHQNIHEELIISFEDSITEIDDRAFYCCDMIKEIALPKNLKSVGNYLFDGCYSLEKVTLNEGLLSIGNGAFCNCTMLKSINIPDTVTQIGDNAFQWCESLKEITIPDSVAKIGNNVFEDCYSLESITIPNSVSEIGDETFRNCESLKEITLPDSISKIGELAFWCCDSLKGITIPESVTEIGEDAFDDTCTIYGISGSYAQKYAESHELKFVPIEAQEDISNENSV